VNFIKKYLIIYWLFVLALILSLRWHKQTSFSKDGLQKILLTQSRFKNQTDDPCQYSVVGEPETAGRYVKLTFKCSDREARFSLDYAAINEKTVGGVILELFRINGIARDLTSLRCNQGGRTVKMEDGIVPQDNIECNL